MGRRAAHTLKGSMRYFGATEAFDRAYALERMGKENVWADADQARQRLEEVLAGFKPALTRFAETGQFTNPMG